MNNMHAQYFLNKVTGQMITIPENLKHPILIPVTGTKAGHDLAESWLRNIDDLIKSGEFIGMAWESGKQKFFDIYKKELAAFGLDYEKLAK